MRVLPKHAKSLPDEDFSLDNRGHETAAQFKQAVKQEILSAMQDVRKRQIHLQNMSNSKANQQALDL